MNRSTYRLHGQDFFLPGDPFGRQLNVFACKYFYMDRDPWSTVLYFLPLTFLVVLVWCSIFGFVIYPGSGRRRLHLYDHGWLGAFGLFTGSFLLRVYLAVFSGRILIEVSGRIPIECREDMFYVSACRWDVGDSSAIYLRKLTRPTAAYE